LKVRCRVGLACGRLGGCTWGPHDDDLASMGHLLPGMPSFLLSEVAWYHVIVVICPTFGLPHSLKQGTSASTTSGTDHLSPVRDYWRDSRPGLGRCRRCKGSVRRSAFSFRGAPNGWSVVASRPAVGLNSSPKSFDSNSAFDANNFVARSARRLILLE